MRRWLVALVLVAAAPVHAGEKVDLTPWLGVVPQVGDTRAYQSASGPSQTELVESVTPHGRGWRIVTQVTTDWNRSPTLLHRVESSLRAAACGTERLEFGKKLLLRTHLLAPIPGDLPTRRYRTDLFKILTERGRVAGFEPLDTPALSFPSVLRVDTEVTYRQHGAEQTGMIQRSEWHLAGVGTVASESGAMTGDPDSWLVSARIDGVVLPPEKP